MVALAWFIVATAAAQDWPGNLTTSGRGNFPNLRPVHALYAFSWSGITAGTADVYFQQQDDDKLVLQGKGRSVGLARILWKFDVDYRSVADANTLHPLELHQVEIARGKRAETNLQFSDEGVASMRIEGGRGMPRTKMFAAQNLNDLHSALLFVRSQPLREREVYRLAVYPANSTYVATITVLGREHLRVRAGSYDAIKLDLQLQRVNKNNQLEPHRKFKRATAWFSDDNDRLLLRIDGQIHVGTVTTELQSARFR